MGKSTAIKLVQVGLTEEERDALDAIAEREHVSMSAIVRELLAEKYPRFRKVHRRRSGYGGRGPWGDETAT
jgi:Ribbon-helix-helix protein, copG family